MQVNIVPYVACRQHIGYLAHENGLKLHSLGGATVIIIVTVRPHDAATKILGTHRATATGLKATSFHSHGFTISFNGILEGLCLLVTAHDFYAFRCTMLLEQ